MDAPNLDAVPHTINLLHQASRQAPITYSPRSLADLLQEPFTSTIVNLAKRIIPQIKPKNNSNAWYVPA